METTNISKLKDNLSAYLKKVQAGETVVVLDRNRPIARIEPIEEAADVDPRVARLIAKGVLLPAKRRPDPDFFKKHKPIKAGASVLQALLEERNEDQR